MRSFFVLPAAATMSDECPPASQAPGACATPAQPTVCCSVAEPDKWHYSLTPYAWLSSLNGNVEAGGVTASVDAGISELIKKLNWITEFHLEAEKKDYGFYVDPIFVKFSSAASAGDVSGSVGFRQWLVEFAGTFRLLERPNLPSGRPSSLKALVGGRFWDLQSTVSTSDGRYGSRTRQWVDPIVGLRGTLEISRQWTFVAQGDIGGFGAASEFTWSFAPVFVYHLSNAGSIVAGYRVLGVDNTSGSGASQSTLDVTYYGPVLGYSFGF